MLTAAQTKTQSGVYMKHECMKESFLNKGNKMLNKTYFNASAKPSVRRGKDRVGVLGTVQSSSSNGPP